MVSTRTLNQYTRVNVGSINNSTTVKVGHDATEYYSNLSEQWAKGEGLVEGKDYSSKHYAGVAKENAEAVANTLNVAQDIINSFDGDISNVLETVSSIRNEALIDITNIRDSVVNDVYEAGNTAVINIDTEECSTLANISEHSTTAINNLVTKASELTEELSTEQSNRINAITEAGEAATDSIEALKQDAEQCINTASNNALNTLQTTSDNAISFVEISASNAIDTVETSLQEYTEISEQIKADNSESSKLAREWAISEVIVDNTDYSAKYWAEKAKDNSGIYYDEVGEETIDVDILEAGYVTTGKLEETVGDISTVLDDILGEEI